MAFEWVAIGAKCVCVKSAEWETIFDGDSEGPDPSYREICVIEDVDIGRDGEVYIGLKGYEHLYMAKRFRPLITQQDDVELFRHLLSPSPLERLDLLVERLNELAED